MPFGPFTLQWRAPSPNPPSPTPLPPGIDRSYISTPSGPLELLSALPMPQSPSPSPAKPALFFAHGGFGCADIWLLYMQYFANRGYPCYAISYRGHGKSWYPGFWRMFFASRDTMATDLVAGVKEVEQLETQRRFAGRGNEEVDLESARVVLVAHSAGGALSQYVLSRGLAKVRGFCMLAAVPGFGSWSCYKFWSLTAPIHFPYRLFHPRYILANTRQVHDAFFSPSTPTPFVQALERLLSPYESMLWPMQALPGFVTGPDVLSSITGWGAKKPSARLLVLAAELDVLCTPAILGDAAGRYRKGYRQLVSEHRIEEDSGSEVSSLNEKKVDITQEGYRDGVAFKVVNGLGHHLQNHVEWERGAVELLGWVKQL